MARRATLARLGVVVAAACQPPGAGAPTTRPAPPAHLITDLIGGWRWVLRTSEAATVRVETETWRLRPSAGIPTQLSGRYLREVEVWSEDRVPFSCNQRPWYRQRAIFDVTVQATATGIAIRETDYRVEPSPCDPGFRQLGSYTGEAAGERLALAWGGGTQTLRQTDGELADLPGAPWPSIPELAGPWRWDATSYQDDGNLRDETEWWELTRRSATRIDATYRRRVTVRSPDGAPIPCAAAPSWSFDDAYVLDGRRDGERWHLHELAADPGQHPCLASTPRRALDEAAVEQLGDHLVLEWRGKRRQVLFRPDREPTAAPGRRRGQPAT